MNPTLAVETHTKVTALLDSFAQRVPEVLQALLASADGLRMAHAGGGLDITAADQLAALTSALVSLGRGEGLAMADTGQDGEVKQLLVEHGAGCLLVMSTDAGLGTTDERLIGSVLAVRTTRDADAGVVAYEMNALITAVGEHLVTSVRAA